MAAQERAATSAPWPTEAPVEVRPIQSPRMVSITGVNGWLAAIGRSTAGSVRAGTNAVDRYGRNISPKGAPFPPWGLLTSGPRAAGSHDMARMNATIMAIAPSHLIGESVGRQPTPRPTAITSAVASRLRARLATMCPASTDEAWIGIERNRSTIPLLLSGANRAARAAAPPVCAAPHHDGVGARPESGAEHDQAGNHVVDVLPAGVEVAAEDVDEQQHQNDGKHQGG